MPPHPTNRMVLESLSKIKIRASKKPDKGKRWLIEVIINHAQNISGTRLIVLYNKLLYPSLRLGLIHQTYVFATHRTLKRQCSRLLCATSAFSLLRNGLVIHPI